ncbi:MAG: LPS biosynthesis protein [Deltaproteobacteria bacterium]|nr:LPS biosynthesis protein [Deltaproteobacteria bacterium]MBU50326.1 LPS biosynthesis protein [Deltaproteobacteria bacterium]|tara:strand:+ start:1563 stop:2828 length:1266 start_codon:yes stop_codon:yes gene_type:complete
MDKVKYLVVGAGMSGLAFANYVKSDDYLILERDTEIGGYCKTIKQDGFVWDYSGHFFHFKRPEIESYLVERMPKEEVQTITKSSKILYKDKLVDFPFQKNIHQLPQEEFIDCLHSLYFRDETPPTNFKEMVYSRFGAGIAEKFLVPYNEKLYACDLTSLDVNAMGRFFPFADIEDIIRNFREPDNHSYNATFTYPKGGAIQYVYALESEIKEGGISLGESLNSIDLKRKVAITNKREVAFEYLISSAPFDRLLQMTGLPHNADDYRANKVLVFNLGFDKKGWEGVHWVYFPERKYCFYRAGFYDNIFDTERMSLYIEIGYPSDKEVDVDGMLAQTLADLKTAGVVEDHNLVSHHTVTLDPAYVHITQTSLEGVNRYRDVLAARGVYTIGRYGGWTYCSIEDNIVEARELADLMNTLEGGAH